MTSTQHQIAAQAQRLIPQVEELYERALALENNYGETLQRVDAAYRDSARNLLHYLAVRQIDIRQLQIGLASIGLSSLGRMEAHTLSTLGEVLFALHCIADQNWAPDAKMLNKGPYIVETLRFLNGILERMDAHQSKRRAMMRRLSVSEMR
jgi:hypothetical protein